MNRVMWRSCTEPRRLRRYSCSSRARTPCSMRDFTSCAAAQNAASGSWSTSLQYCVSLRRSRHSRQSLIEVAGPHRRKEGRHVHAVGHVADGILRRRNLRPEIGAQLRRHAAVDAADAIDAARAVERQPRHVEPAVDAGRATQLQQPVDGHAHRPGHGAEVRDEQVVVERVVACGHRRMRGEHALCRDGFESRLEAASQRPAARAAAPASGTPHDLHSCARPRAPAPSARSARTPPMPSTISCLMRCDSSPP